MLVSWVLFNFPFNLLSPITFTPRQVPVEKWTFYNLQLVNEKFMRDAKRCNSMLFFYTTRDVSQVSFSSQITSRFNTLDQIKWHNEREKISIFYPWNDLKKKKEGNICSQFTICDSLVTMIRVACACVNGLQWVCSKIKVNSVICSCVGGIMWDSCKGKQEQSYSEILEIENPFTRRAQSHEIMIMLFRGKHMGNNSMFYVQFLNFLYILPPFSFIPSYLRLSYFLLRSPNKSWNISFSSQDFLRGLTCDSNAD